MSDPTYVTKDSSSRQQRQHRAPTKFSQFFNNVKKKTSLIREEAEKDRQLTQSKMRIDNVNDKVAKRALETGTPIIPSVDRLIQIAQDNFGVVLSASASSSEEGRNQGDRTDLIKLEKLADALDIIQPVVQNDNIDELIGAEDKIKSPEEVRKEFFDMLKDRRDYIEMTQERQNYTHITRWIPLTTGFVMGSAILYGGYKLQATFAKSILGEMVKSNMFKMSVNMVIVAQKVARHLTENDFENWSAAELSSTILAGGIEFVRLSSKTLLKSAITAADRYLLAGVIMSSGIGIVGFMLIEVFILPKTDKWLSATVKKILIKKDAFDDVVMEQVMTDELLMQKHQKAILETNAPAIYTNYFLPFANMFANADVAAIAACSIPLNIQAFYHAGFSLWGVGLSSEQLDLLLNTTLLNGIVAPALVRQLSRLLAVKSVQNMMIAPASKLWRMIPERRRKYWEKVVTHYEFARYASRIGWYIFQTQGLIVAGRLITVENYRAAIHSVISEVWGAPDYTVVDPVEQENQIDVVFTSNADRETAKLLLENGPSSTQKILSEQLAAVQLERNKQQGILAYMRLSHMSEEDFDRLDDPGKLDMARLAGLPNQLLTFNNLKEWRSKQSFVHRLDFATVAGLPKDKSAVPVIKKIEALKQKISKIEEMRKKVLLAEIYIINNLHIPAAMLLSSKNTLPLDLVNKIDFLRGIETTYEDRVNWNLLKQRMDVLGSRANNTSTGPDAFRALLAPQRETRLGQMYHNAQPDDIKVVIGADPPTFSEYSKYVNDFMLARARGEKLPRWDNDYNQLKLYYDLTRDDGKALKDQVLGIFDRSSLSPYPWVETLTDVTGIILTEAQEPLQKPPKSALTEELIPLKDVDVETQKGLGSNAQVTVEKVRIADQVINERIQDMLKDTAISMSQKQSLDYGVKMSHTVMNTVMFGGADSLNNILDGINSFQELDMQNQMLDNMDPRRIIDSAKKNGVGAQTCLIGPGMKIVTDPNDPEAVIIVNEDGSPANMQCLHEPYLFQIMAKLIETVIRISGSLIPVVGPIFATQAFTFATVTLSLGAGLIADTLGCLGSPKIPTEPGEARRTAIICNVNNFILAASCKAGAVLSTSATAGTFIRQLLGVKWCKRVAVYTDVRDVLEASGHSPKEALKWFNDLSLKISKVTTTENPWYPGDGAGKFVSLTSEVIGELFNVMWFMVKSIINCPGWLRPYMFGSSSVSTLAQSVNQLEEAGALEEAVGVYTTEFVPIIRKIIQGNNVKMENQMSRNIKIMYPEIDL
jgi:hypothetical protein